MAKRDLGSLLGASLDERAATLSAPEEPPSSPLAAEAPAVQAPAAEAQAVEPGRPTPAAAAPRRPTRAAAAARPKGAEPVPPLPTHGYASLDRKETRLRTEQVNSLAVLTRRLNRDRRGTGERLTDNTLIRVAVDLLLRDADRLAGTTEAELLRSMLTD